MMNLTQSCRQGVLLCGSPKSQGSTMLLLQAVARGLSDAGISPNIIVLDQLNIGYCRGCRACEDGPCALQDDMAYLMEKLALADVIVLGAPSYWGDVPAQMKTFIDRCLPLCDTQEGGSRFPRGKAGIALTARAGRSVAESYKVLGTLEHFFGHLGIRTVGRVHVEQVSGPDDLQRHKDALHTAYQAGLRALEPRPTPAFTLRLAEETDIPHLAVMNRTLIADEGSDNAMTSHQLLQRMTDFLRGEYQAVVVEVEGKAAGYCLYRPQPEGVYVRQYMIQPLHRMQGLGKAAFFRIHADYLRQYGNITLDVLQGNGPGLAFWRSIGFAPYVQQMRLHLPE